MSFLPDQFKVRGEALEIFTFIEIGNHVLRVTHLPHLIQCIEKETFIQGTCEFRSERWRETRLCFPGHRALGNNDQGIGLRLHKLPLSVLKFECQVRYITREYPSQSIPIQVPTISPFLDYET